LLELDFLVDIFYLRGHVKGTGSYELLIQSLVQLFYNIYGKNK